MLVEVITVVFLLWSSSDLLLPSFIQHLLIRVPLWERALPAPQFICLFVCFIIYLYQYGLMHMYFILWAIKQSYCFLCCSNCLSFGQFIFGWMLYCLPLRVGTVIFFSVWHSGISFCERQLCMKCVRLRKKPEEKKLSSLTLRMTHTYIYKSSCIWWVEAIALAWKNNENIHYLGFVNVLLRVIMHFFKWDTMPWRHLSILDSFVWA